jgi:hypothetical protein
LWQVPAGRWQRLLARADEVIASERAYFGSCWLNLVGWSRQPSVRILVPGHVKGRHGFDEQIFGANEQIPGPDKGD